MDELKLPQIILYSRGDRVPNDYLKINSTSKSKEEWSRQFSPFYLGPVEVTPMGPCVSQNMENAWQYSKRYKGQSIDEWAAWADIGFSQTKAVRFPMGRGAKPMFSYWQGEELSYIAARFKIYGPLYEWCILNHAYDSFLRLKKLVDDGTKIAIFDYDGYFYQGEDMSLDDVIYNPKRKMGHSFILMGMLQNDRFWEKDYDVSKVKARSVKRLKL